MQCADILYGRQCTSLHTITVMLIWHTGEEVNVPCSPKLEHKPIFSIYWYFQLVEVSPVSPPAAGAYHYKAGTHEQACTVFEQNEEQDYRQEPHWKGKPVRNIK